MRRYQKVILSALLLGWIMLPMAADARMQMTCGQRGAVVTALDKMYAEKPVSLGIADNGSVIEVFASAEGSWTIVLTSPTGISCLLAAGESWETIPTKAAGLQS